MNDDNIYVKILKWAYGKQHYGFTRQELDEKFGLKGDLHQWVQKIFFERPHGDKALIGHFISRDGQDYYALTDKGVSAAVDYLELQAAMESAKSAKKTANIAIVISVVTALVSIILSVYQIVRPQEVYISEDQARSFVDTARDLQE
jgi:hypothetical protein